VSLLSNLTGEKIGARWQTIWTTTSLQLSGANLNRPKPVGIHATRMAQYAKHKVTQFYGANCPFFLDGTIIWLVPTISSIIAQDSKEKFGLVVAKQEAFLSKVCTGTSWEFSPKYSFGLHS
jgi:hypothetical protein